MNFDYGYMRSQRNQREKLLEECNQIYLASRLTFYGIQTLMTGSLVILYACQVFSKESSLCRAEDKEKTNVSHRVQLAFQVGLLLASV